MRADIGERVGAIHSADSTTVNFFGYGVYQGYHPYAPFGDDYIIQNPRILLDSGEHVYGAQCWWGKEDEIKRRIGDRKVVMVEVEK